MKMLLSIFCIGLLLPVAIDATEYNNNGRTIEIPGKKIIEAFIGHYYPNEKSIYSLYTITLPHQIWRIGGKVSFKFGEGIFSTSFSYGYTKNCNYLILTLSPPPFQDLKFRLLNLSFLGLYHKKFINTLGIYTGAGIGLFNMNFSYLERIKNYDYIAKNKELTYLSPLITFGMHLKVFNPSFYVAIQAEIFLYHLIKKGDSELIPNEPLPGLTMNFGYKLSI